MAQRTGTVVTAPMRINDDTIPAPIVYQEEVQGGAHSGALLTSRDGLAVWHRAWGMTYTVYNDGANNGIYFLKYGQFSTNIADNQNWILQTGTASQNVKKLDVIVNGSGNINVPGNCVLYAILVNALGAMSQFSSGYTSITDDLVMTQPVDPGYQMFSKGIYLPSPTTIYFNGVNPQSTCSVIIFTF